MRIKWFVNLAWNRGLYELLGINDDGGPEIAVMQPINPMMKRQSRETVIELPTLALHPKDAQALLQALWDAGLRPSEQTDRSGEVKALQAHIGFAEHVAKALLHAAKPPVILQSMDDL